MKNINVIVVIILALFTFESVNGQSRHKPQFKKRHTARHLVKRRN